MNQIDLRAILLMLLFPMFAETALAQVQFVRDREHFGLTEWRFKKGVVYQAQRPNFDDSDWQSVKVPHTYSLDAINDLGYYRGVAWYRTKFRVPQDMAKEQIFLRFEAVGQEAIVYVNGQQVGDHIGGYSSFCFDITADVLPGQENTIAVQVSNAPNFKRIPVNDELFNHYGGIYRPVHIFATPKTHISPVYYASSGLFVQLKSIDANEANLEIRAHLSNGDEQSKIHVEYEIYNAKNKIVANNKEVLFFKGDSVFKSQVDINNPVLWEGKNNPHLYKIVLTISDGTSIDRVTQNFGLRTFSVDPEKGFMLNKMPYRLYGVALHQEWQDVGPALKKSHHETDMAFIEEIGATSIRLSHYQHSDLTYQLADRLGLLVWTEIPFVHDYSGREGENAEQQLRELILQNYNHPSIYTWGLWNEVRAYNRPEEACVIITEGLQKLAHELDPDRPTSSASDRGMESNMGGITDLQAWNKYYGWYYGEYEDMASWLDESREKYPQIALGLSEYGIGGNIELQDITKLEKPVGNYFPEQEQTKYHEISWRIINERDFIWSSYVWNLFDFSVAGWNRGGTPNLNHKGLVTFDRQVKKDAFYFYKVNWNKQPMLHIAESRHKERSEQVVDVKVFTNQDKVTLFLNGNKTGKKVENIGYNTIVFKNIKLKLGENKLVVKSGNGEEELSHEVTWILSQ